MPAGVERLIRNSICIERSLREGLGNLMRLKDGVVGRGVMARIF